jgi:tetratricopeptide (TPR) repeat protein
MKNSLTPLIISFAAIILITFVVINSKPGSSSYRDNENANEKNVLRLGREKKTSSREQSGKNIPARNKYIPDSSEIIKEAQKELADNQKEKAEDLLKTLLVFSPNDENALALLGGIYYRSGRYHEAEDLFLRLLDSKGGNDAVVLTHLSSVLAKQKRYEEAISNGLKAANIQPDFAEAQINLSAIYAASGDSEKSVRHLLLAYKLMRYGILAYSVDPVFDTVRALPEFQDIITKARKDWENHRQEEEILPEKKQTDEQDKNTSR